jgi:carboxyl-terminal processing protease
MIAMTLQKRLGLLALLLCASIAQAGDDRRQNHQDFGLSPDAYVGPLEPTPRGPITLREKLLQEGILEESTFTASARPPLKFRARQPQVEELPAPPKTAPTVTPAAPADESDRQPPRQPSIAEKIQYRYSDPRELRLLERLNQQSAVALYVEIAQMIDGRHIKPTTYARRVDAAFEHLNLALTTRSFQHAAQLRADDQSLDRLKESLTQMRGRVTARNLDDAINTLQRVQELVDRQVGIHPGAVGLEFVHAQLDTLDQFSSLIPPERTGGPSVGLKDNIVGIGVEVEGHAEGLKILKVLPGGPAADAKLRRGDIVLAIDRQQLKGLELNQAVEHIMGQAGTPLKLDLKRGEQQGAVTLVRRQIALHAVASRMLDEDTKVGYIKLDSFTESSVKELDDALMSLHNAGMKSLIFDVRGNPGGLLTSAVAISDRFLPSGTIVSTRGRNASDNSREEATYAQTWKVPLVMLIDRNSASASEILAAAIQENGRGLVIGERSYGKGTVQTLFPLQSASAGLRLTTARFYSPEGREMAGAGVTPDLKVDPRINDDPAQDAALTAAKKIASDPRLKQMAARFIRTSETPQGLRPTI